MVKLSPCGVAGVNIAGKFNFAFVFRLNMSVIFTFCVGNFLSILLILNFPIMLLAPFGVIFFTFGVRGGGRGVWVWAKIALFWCGCGAGCILKNEVISGCVSPP